ncbi:MAG: hypothetical protein ACYSW7_00095 [Planctomycetota bacterium]
MVLTVVVMYFRDHQQQRDLKLRRLETRIEALEEWGLPAQNQQTDRAKGW